MGTIDLYHFRPTMFSDLDLGCRSPRQQKKNMFSHIFLYTFQLINIKFGGALKQLKLNILILQLGEIYVSAGNNCCFTDFVNKNYKNEILNVGMHSHVYDAIWLKLGVLIDFSF